MALQQCQAGGQGHAGAMVAPHAIDGDGGCLISQELAVLMRMRGRWAPLLAPAVRVAPNRPHTGQPGKSPRAWSALGRGGVSVAIRRIRPASAAPWQKAMRSNLLQANNEEARMLQPGSRLRGAGRAPKHRLGRCNAPARHCGGLGLRPIRPLQTCS